MYTYNIFDFDSNYMIPILTRDNNEMSLFGYLPRLVRFNFNKRVLEYFLKPGRVQVLPHPAPSRIDYI